MKQILALARKNLILTSCAIVATCIVTVLAPWILRFHATDFSASPSDWGVFGDYLGGALSTIISALGFIGIIATIKSQSDTLSTQLSSIVQEKEIRDDAVYSKQSLECLSEALDKIKTLDGKIYRNRTAWLESARLIMTAQTLAEQIKSDSMKLTYKAAEKVIRSRFGSLFDPENSPETMQPSYFYEMEWDRWAEGKKQHPIDKISAYVIYQFISWQDDDIDILRTVTEININKISQRYFGARLFLEREPSKS